jgi:predicted RNA-binding protein YlqC (UPF0109 family)
MADYRDLVEYIVKNIVDNPDAAEIEVFSRNRADIVEIRLDPEDVGRVIGRGGRTIEAIRAVVKAAAVKDHRRVNVEVIADDEALDDEEHGDESTADGAPQAEAAAGLTAEAAVAENAEVQEQ